MRASAPDGARRRLVGAFGARAAAHSRADQGEATRARPARGRAPARRAAGAGASLVRRPAVRGRAARTPGAAPVARPRGAGAASGYRWKRGTLHSTRGG